jgi:hypothetical protein
MGGGTGLVASTAPTVAGMGAQGLMTAPGAASMLGTGGTMFGANQARMAMQGLQMANQQPTPPATGQATFRGAKQTELLEPIQSLLTMAQPRRRERMSLL